MSTVLCQRYKRSNLGYIALLSASLVLVAVSNATADISDADKLIKLARKHFTNDITFAEKQLLQHATSGESLDCPPTKKDSQNTTNNLCSPSTADRWSTNRVIRADRIAWLCTDPAASSLVTYRGITLEHARIEGELDLKWAKVPFPMDLEKCAFTDTITLENTHLRGLDLTGSFIHDLDGDGLEVEKDIFMCLNFNADGDISLVGTTVGGSLECSDGQFMDLVADGMEIKGDIRLDRKFRAKGKVSFQGVVVGGNLQCSGGHFESGGTNAFALTAETAKISGDVMLDNSSQPVGTNSFHSEGTVSFTGTSIGGDFNCNGAHFEPKDTNTVALNIGTTKIGGDVFLDGTFHSEGEVNLYGAIIGGNLQCSRGHFQSTGTNSIAIEATAAKITGHVFLDNTFHAEGTVSFTGATIGGDLDCGGGNFESEGTNVVTFQATASRINGNVRMNDAFRSAGKVSLRAASISGDVNFEDGHFMNTNTNSAAIDGNLMRTEGNVYFSSKSQVDGQFSLMDATIGRDLQCLGSRFRNADGVAIVASDSRVGGNITFSKQFIADGGVDLIGTTIGGDLNCESGNFINENTNSYAINAERIRIDGDVFLRRDFQAKGKVSFAHAYVARNFEWHHVKSPEKTILDLRSAKIGTLEDDEVSWPKTNNLYLDGFNCDEIRNFTNTESRIAWLRHQPTNQFLPQTYEQLAGILRKMGQEEEAVTVLIEKNREHARFTTIGSPAWWWYEVFGRFIRYGYRP